MLQSWRPEEDTATANEWTNEQQQKKSKKNYNEFMVYNFFYDGDNNAKIEKISQLVLWKTICFYFFLDFLFFEHLKT